MYYSVWRGASDTIDLRTASARSAGQIRNNRRFGTRRKGRDLSTQGPSISPASTFTQGTNGGAVRLAHTKEAWSINPGTIQDLFDETDGTHPIFNLLDADNPETANVTTVEGRLDAFSMLLSRGVFRRGGVPRPNSEWELIAAEDPNGFANLNRLVHWRRAMPTINFAQGSATVNWDGGNSIGADQHAGLVNQATRNVTVASRATSRS